MISTSKIFQLFLNKNSFQTNKNELKSEVIFKILNFLENKLTVIRNDKCLVTSVGRFFFPIFSES